MPIARVNSWTNNAADLENAQLLSAEQINRVAVGIERLTENQPNPDVVVDRLNVIASASDALASVAIRGFEDVATRMGQTVEAILAAGRQIDLVAIETARTAAGVEAIARRLPEPEVLEVDPCTALYAAAVDVTGAIVARTRLGRVLHAGKNYPTLRAVADTDEKTFVEAVQKEFGARLDQKDGANFRPLEPFLTEAVLSCFWRRARAVMAAIDQIEPDGAAPKDTSA